MILIKTDRVYVAYARENRHVRWCYADYCGRWATMDEAIQKVKDMYDNSVEYMIFNMETDETVRGFTQ